MSECKLIFQALQVFRFFPSLNIHSLIYRLSRDIFSFPFFFQMLKKNGVEVIAKRRKKKKFVHVASRIIKSFASLHISSFTSSQQTHASEVRVGDMNNEGVKNEWNDEKRANDNK